MEERILPAERAAAERRRQLRRAAKRGVVAGYIHELSVRHKHGGAAPATSVAGATDSRRSTAV